MFQMRGSGHGGRRSRYGKEAKISLISQPIAYRTFKAVIFIDIDCENYLLDY